MQPALFLDRDGVIVDEAEYLADPAQLRLLPGSAEAIAEVNRQDVPVIVVTNQSGVARGYFPESRVAKIHEELARLHRKVPADGGLASGPGCGAFSAGTHRRPRRTMIFPR